VRKSGKGREASAMTTDKERQEFLDSDAEVTDADLIGALDMFKRFKGRAHRRFQGELLEVLLEAVDAQIEDIEGMLRGERSRDELKHKLRQMFLN
jgi:hypothetical protein